MESTDSQLSEYFRSKWSVYLIYRQMVKKILRNLQGGFSEVRQILETVILLFEMNLFYFPGDNSLPLHDTKEDMVIKSS